MFSTEEGYAELVENLEAMTDIGIVRFEGAVAAHLEGDLPDDSSVQVHAWPEMDGTLFHLGVTAEALGPDGFVRAPGSVTYVGRDSWGQYSETAVKAFVERTGIPALVPLLRATLHDGAARLSLKLPMLGLWKTDMNMEDHAGDPESDGD